ncbi:DUF4411 family protein [Larkinella sp. VNQ87]|uniref:DUF4411 family protein n=1 Tax=Larkinella sp. VNQ87 TaxID=3400921 RepID=UPI003C11772D
MLHQKYCLDANVLIVPWQKYYSVDICPSYWELLDKLGRSNVIFIPEQVYEEITVTEDELSLWLKSSRIPIRKTDGKVTKCLSDIFIKDPAHRRLVDSTKGRSLADPWVIAHALNERACVVTKEEKITDLRSLKVKIPNVCDNMGVRWIDDFQLIKELKISFSCTI